MWNYKFVQLGLKETIPGCFVCIGFWEEKDINDTERCRNSDSLEDWDKYVWLEFLKEEVFV